MYISPYWRQVLVPPNFMKFGIRGQLTYVITCVKFLVDRFRGYGVLTPPKLPFPIDLLCRPYNSSHYRATLWFVINKFFFFLLTQTANLSLPDLEQNFISSSMSPVYYTPHITCTYILHLLLTHRKVHTNSTTAQPRWNGKRLVAAALRTCNNLTTAEFSLLQATCVVLHNNQQTSSWSITLSYFPY